MSAPPLRHLDAAPSGAPGYRADQQQPRMAFFTDTTVCIGCKACEVACKEWNDVPDGRWDFTGDSYDNTGHLSADAWRHVAFIEQQLADDSFRWLMMSDVCKHCATAGCLDNCPTGALFTTEFGSVVVQSDICNGCGYCVVGCPFGVISRRESDGKAWKCTMCYDRLRDGAQPACAKACPTDSINFGPIEDMRALAHQRLAHVDALGYRGARLYGDAPGHSPVLPAGGDAGLAGVGGTGALFLLLDEPEVYGLPPDPVAPTRRLAGEWSAALAAAATVAVALLGAFRGARR